MESTDDTAFRSLTVVLPAFNEQDNIQAAVRSAARAAARLVPEYEIVVVDDGSRDATAERLSALQAELGDRVRVIRHPVNRGYGAALRAGFAAATGDLVFYTDSDNQFDLDQLAAALPLMAGHDVVLGYRRHRQDPLLRLCTSAVFNRLTCLALGVRARDLNCSFKLFRRGVLQSLPLESDDFFIDAELVARLHRAGARCAQMPVRHLPRTAGRSSVRASDVPRTLRSLARMRARLRAEQAARGGARPSSGAGAGRVALCAVAAVSAAYLVQVPQHLRPAGWLSGPSVEGFHAREPGGFRWSSGGGTLRFQDAGPGVRFRLEVDASAWRPRGRPLPALRLSAGGETAESGLAAQPRTVAVPTSAAGVWRSDVVATLQSEAFRPEGGDARLLGVRVHEARLVPLDGVVGLRRPPVGQLVAVSAAALLLFAGLVRAGLHARGAERVAQVAILAFAMALVMARPTAAALSWPATILVGLAAAVVWLAPRGLRAAPVYLGAWAHVAGRGARVVASWPAVAVACMAVLAAVSAHLAYPRLVIDLGSGTEAPVARRFAASDGADGVTFRRPLRGAEVDLRDFGGGAAWLMTVTASSSGPPGTLRLARAGDADVTVPLGADWATHVFEAAAPWGWRSGLAVSFLAGEASGVRVDRLEIDRGASWPSLRVASAVAMASLLIVFAAGATGVRPATAYAAGALAALGQAAALARVPVAAIPFAVPFAGICLAGAGLATSLAAAARIRSGPALPAGAYLAASGGFVAWFGAAAFPLYRGGHFLFHSNIAEEIWRGRFLLFYLPYPGSTLSRQDQWGSVIVPHPCLFHTVIAPLAALPQPWFHAVEKAMLALMLASLALVAARVAQRIAGDRAALGAAVVFATLAPAFQILGLGHTMMLFGIWASSMALAFVLLRFEQLTEKTFWIGAVLWLTLCFLSYTASLLFVSLVLVAAVMALHRGEPVPARALALALAGAWLLAFGLYYVNWAWPFVTQSVPHIAASFGAAGGGGGDLTARLALQPHKLAYTFGSAWVPILGLAGLFLARRAPRPAHILLLSWASLLVFVGGLDVFFNFLRKHHYFVMVPVAVGGGVLLSRIAERGRAGRAAAVALALASAALGLRMAVDVALGRIP